MNARNRFLGLVAAALVLATSSVSGRFAPALAGPVVVPGAVASGDTPPPLSATATPRPAGDLIKYTAQLLDYRSGFAFFTTGDGFRVAPNVKIVDAKTDGPTALTPQTRVYARAAFDPASGQIVELGLSQYKLPEEATFDAIKKFVVALSTPYANPDLANGGEGISGKPVLVTFRVEVPPKTPFSDPVYIATDKSGWSATALRMDRLDALHYTLTMPINSGTTFLYRFTRGSWTSAERGQNGLEVPPRKFTLRDAEVRLVSNVVYAWGDSNEFAPDLGQAIPTPFNVIPFNLPPHK
jgi:hypothetical protein